MTFHAVQVIEILVEESNVQPVNSPVTVRHTLPPAPWCTTWSASYQGQRNSHERKIHMHLLILVH
jgi:hypothetical protein